LLHAFALAAAAFGPGAAGHPLRHLSYAVHFGGRAETVYHYGGIATSLAGVGTAYRNGGYDDTIDVDVLARFLGRGFVDGNHMDEKNHWRVTIEQGTTSVVTDYTILKNENGVLSISETGELKDENGRSHSNGQIVYDMKRTVPLSVHEESSTAGMGGGMPAAFE